MTASTLVGDRISIDADTVRQAQETQLGDGSDLTLRTGDGQELPLPSPLRDMLLRALASIARTGSVTIAQVPDQLSSTVAAEMLGVSRPTLLKWAKNKEIDSFMVGSHTRFRREDVMNLRARRRTERRRAFDELRELDRHSVEFG